MNNQPLPVIEKLEAYLQGWNNARKRMQQVWAFLGHWRETEGVINEMRSDPVQQKRSGKVTLRIIMRYAKHQTVHSSCAWSSDQRGKAKPGFGWYVLPILEHPHVCHVDCTVHWRRRTEPIRDFLVDDPAWPLEETVHYYWIDSLVEQDVRESADRHDSSHLQLLARIAADEELEGKKTSLLRRSLSVLTRNRSWSVKSATQAGVSRRRWWSSNVRW